ncbi:hypothetical protein FRAHR75_300052 [Frankia sp. Hr75.2]|nr:hypothetical protein FRAHR75_300052 [Frankia sp. Hr75.2]SQD95964.1 hypothetical protein FMEAI12_3390031 [Parafrankia sp. Ea1.12]
MAIGIPNGSFVIHALPRTGLARNIARAVRFTWSPRRSAAPYEEVMGPSGGRAGSGTRPSGGGA